MTIDAFLTQLCEHCGIGADQIEVSLVEVEDRLEIQLTVPEEESGRFIGYHGEALQAIQRVVRLAFEQRYPDQKIILNVNDYRERRQAQLEEKVQTIAQQVLEDGRSYTFSNFIPSHERFIIHSTLTNVPGGEKLESFSQGDGMSRRLTIALKQTDEVAPDKEVNIDEPTEDSETAEEAQAEISEEAAE